MFVKYGDGEFRAANYYEGGNCDGTPYTRQLGDRLRKSFVYNSQQPNSMIGCWHDKSDMAFWKSLGNDYINWVEYHTVIIDNKTRVSDSPDKLELYKAIRQSTRKKIYVANASMYRACQIFSIESFIEIDPSDWFEIEYESILKSVREEVVDDSNTLILTSAGMGAKALIHDLHKEFPKAIYIDVGSAFDMLCTKRATRHCTPGYEELYEYLKEIL